MSFWSKHIYVLSPLLKIVQTHSNCTYSMHTFQLQYDCYEEAFKQDNIQFYKSILVRIKMGRKRLIDWIKCFNSSVLQYGTPLECFI